MIVHREERIAALARAAPWKLCANERHMVLPPEVAAKLEWGLLAAGSWYSRRPTRWLKVGGDALQGAGGRGQGTVRAAGDIEVTDVGQQGGGALEREKATAWGGRERRGGRGESGMVRRRKGGQSGCIHQHVLGA